MLELLKKIFHFHSWRYLDGNKKRICNSCKQKQQEFASMDNDCGMMIIRYWWDNCS